MTIAPRRSQVRSWLSALCAFALLAPAGCGPSPTAPQTPAAAPTGQSGSPGDSPLPPPRRVWYDSAELAAALPLADPGLIVSRQPGDRLQVQVPFRNQAGAEKTVELTVQFVDAAGVLLATARRTLTLKAEAVVAVTFIAPVAGAADFRLQVQLPPDLQTADLPPPPPPPPAAPPPLPPPVPATADESRPLTRTVRPRVEASADEEVVAGGILRADLTAAAQAFSKGLLEVVQKGDGGGTPRVSVLPFSNRTTQQLDGPVLAGQLAVALRKALGDKVKIQQADNLDQVLANYRTATQAAAGDEKKEPLRMFYCTVVLASSTVRRGAEESTYILLTAELTDLASGEVVWTDDYELKKQAPPKEAAP